MAVSSRPTPKSPRSFEPQLSSPHKGTDKEEKKQKKKKKKKEKSSDNKELSDKEEKMKIGDNKDEGSNSQAGIRFVGGRIYDPLNGKTCHQCRQKTMDFAASCKYMKGNRQCTIKLCHKCLLNRYGEKAEDVALLDGWKCPKCRGICNCSFCMKKRGHKPTGQLFHVARESGFRSVSELLLTRGPDGLDDYKSAKGVLVLPNKCDASEKGPMLGSPRILGKENFLDGSTDFDTLLQSLTPISKLKKLKAMQREGLKEISNENGNDGAKVSKSGHKKARVGDEVSQNVPTEEDRKTGNLVRKKKSGKDSKNVEGALVKKKKMKKQVCDGSSNNCHGNGKPDAANHGGSNAPSDLDAYEAAVELSKLSNGIKDKDGRASNGIKDHDWLLIQPDKVNTYTSELKGKRVEPDIPLPPRTCITTVAGMELSSEDVGNALQFLEFCAAFGKVLDLMKGQPEAIMREIVNGRRERRSQYRSQQSLVTQIHIRLLNVIQKDMLEEFEVSSMKNLQNSWFQALGEFVSESHFISKEFRSESFDRGNEGYDELTISEKLKLLNFLCDEALNTSVLRSWIEDQNSKFLERQKKAKEKVTEAKDKERQLKQKIQDEIAKAVIERNGVPLSISVHDALVSQIKSEAAQAHAEMVKVMSMVPKKRQRSDAVRTDPVLLDVDGTVFWRLNCHHGLSDILLQDMRTWSSVAPDESWFCYTDEQKQEVEKYVSRTKRIRLWTERTSLRKVEAIS